MCGYRAGAAELRVLPGHGKVDAGGFEVRLVREFKGDTVRGLLHASQDVLDRLPGRLRSMVRSLRAGDLDAADARLEAAVGSLVPGPGHRRRRLAPSLTLALWLWLASLVGALLWLVS